MNIAPKSLVFAVGNIAAFRKTGLERPTIWCVRALVKEGKDPKFLAIHNQILKKEGLNLKGFQVNCRPIHLYPCRREEDNRYAVCGCLCRKQQGRDVDQVEPCPVTAGSSKQEGIADRLGEIWREVTLGVDVRQVASECFDTRPHERTPKRRLRKMLEPCSNRCVQESAPPAFP